MKEVWGRRNVKWESQDAVGASGGLFVLWGTRYMAISNRWIVEFFVSVLLEEEGKIKLNLKEEFHIKIREEEIKWRQRSRCRWLKEGDKNTKFFLGIVS